MSRLADLATILHVVRAAVTPERKVIVQMTDHGTSQLSHFQMNADHVDVRSVRIRGSTLHMFIDVYVTRGEGTLYAHCCWHGVYIYALSDGGAQRSWPDDNAPLRHGRISLL